MNTQSPVKENRNRQLTNKQVLSINNYSWFYLSIFGLFIFSVILRFWEINKFNSLVFDEVYYALYGVNYLQGVPFFDAHPPLGKYMIALGIWLGSHLPFSTGIPNGLTGRLLSPFIYRWIDALMGSFVPLVVAGIAYQLSRRRSYALMAGLFTALDGLLLVESRFALINIYLVLFGLLGHWLFLLALDCRGFWRGFRLALSGLFFGASVAVKWNGLGFLLGIYLLWLTGWMVGCFVGKYKVLNIEESGLNNVKNGVFYSQISFVKSHFFTHPLRRLTKIGFMPMLVYLGALPAVVYCLIWIPHLEINQDMGFAEVHQQIFLFHENMKSGSEVHPYCSPWWTWPVMLRPMVYLFEKAINTHEQVPSYPPLPEGVGEVFYDVHAMGNPLLWWLSIFAIFVLFVMLVERFWVGENQAIRDIGPSSAEFSTVFYVLVNYLANFLPWAMVSRCTFIYLYMPASVFSFLASAWLVERWLRSYDKTNRALGVTAVFVIVSAFVFWLPVYLGLPLSAHGFDIRMWLRSWI